MERLTVLFLLVACNQNTSGRGTTGATTGGRPDLSAVSFDLSVAGNGDGGPTMSCLPDSPDQTGCSCSPEGSTRTCYPSSADPATRNVGLCKDGMQTCMSSGEFDGYGACAGAVTPVNEVCNDTLDNNCDGRVDCMDPTCALDPACNTGCTDGMTRPCYTGPSGTEGVGTCKSGTQTCTGGQWPATCVGQVLPTAENCTDALDHDCNHLPGCLDLFACLLNAACQGNCDMTKVDTGCVCPTGAGDTATCPDGMFDKPKGSGLIPMDQCCPCTSGDCGNAGCCGETVCAGNAQCAGLTCKPLPSSCNGQVNADCDDFPEDCDEPCCKCTTCP